MPVGVTCAECGNVWTPPRNTVLSGAEWMTCHACLPPIAKDPPAPPVAPEPGEPAIHQEAAHD